MKIAVKRVIVLLSGIVSGILLFLASFSMSAQATLFDPGYHSKALQKLGVTEMITGLIKGAIETADDQNDFASFIQERITEDLIAMNIRSLTRGLMDYISGTADTLPYLHLSYGSNNHSEPLDIGSLSTGESPMASLAGLEKVNLQLLTMFLDEQNINEKLTAISLFQFINKDLLKISVLIFLIISIIILCQKNVIILGWLKSSVITYSSASLTAAYIITRLKTSIYNRIPNILSTPFDGIDDLAASYLLTLVDSIIGQLLLITVFNILVLIIIHYITIKRSEPLFKEAFWEDSVKRTAFALIIILSATLCFQINNAASEYSDRHLERAVMYLKEDRDTDMGNDARDDEICFLRVLLNDSVTGEPVDDIVIYIYKDNRNEDSFEIVPQYSCIHTNDNGILELLLKKGTYRLMIMTSQTVYTNLTFYSPAVFDFELLRPGRTELRLILDKQDPTAMKLGSASLQYIP